MGDLQEQIAQLEQQLANIKVMFVLKYSRDKDNDVLLDSHMLLAQNLHRPQHSDEAFLVQAQAAAALVGVQTQKDINAQLMGRKEEIEWQLMAALANASCPPKREPVSLVADSGALTNGSVAVLANF